MIQPVTVPPGETKYTTAFYTQHLSGSARSARAILGQLLGYFIPSSMLDVGCGHGTWLSIAHELGIQELDGFDGSYVDKSALLISPSHFTARDLRDEFKTPRRYDLTISVEVAEHLPAMRAPGFVRDLCRTSDVILFSAASPYQGGEDHLNEQWPEYWGILFRQFGYRCFDLFRDMSWDNADVEPWYAQNAFLFVKEDNSLCTRLTEFSADRRVLSKIHPEIFLINATRYRPEAIAQIEAELREWRSVVSAFRAGEKNLPNLLEDHNEDYSEMANHFTRGRLNYKDSATINSEIITMNAAYMAAEEAKDKLISDLHEQEENFRETVVRLRQALRDERNNTLNALIESSVLLNERHLGAQLQSSKAELSQALHEVKRELDEVKRENALLRQASSLPHVVARVLPPLIKTAVRRIRDDMDIRYLQKTSYFDSDWYLAQNPDVRASGVDPIRHFVKHGAAEGRNPRSDFNTKQFSANRAKTRRPRRNIFVEYLDWHKGRDVLKPSKPIESVSQRLPATSIQIDAEAVTHEVAAAWYGSERLADEQLFQRGEYARVDAAAHDRQTEVIIARFLSDLDTENSLPAENALAPLNLLRKAFQSTTISESVTPSASVATYSIITPFFSHLDFFRKAAESVARLMEATLSNGNAPRIEWIIVNDDPKINVTILTEAIPADIRPATRIISDGFNRGISIRQNEGVAAANNEWLLFLDCDDLIESHCIRVLDHYICHFPYCRFISSAIIDIDENAIELRRRIRTFGIDGIYEKGMNAGHLAAIRRDLFDDIGSFDKRFSGCQDYDFALRAAIHEPILLVPEHLYSYRWHTKSQSVAQFERQTRISRAVRKAFLRRFMDQNWPEVNLGSNFKSQEFIGVCLIRTQGRRLELLEEAINSILQQTVSVTPCIVVHGERPTLEIIKQWVSRFGAEVIVLHADSSGRRRGYPLNVGLDFVEDNAERFDFFCILDDDDIYYPMFAERLSATIKMTGAHIAYCTTNSRVPGQHTKSAHPPLPTAALVGGNFIPINAYVVRTDLLIESGARIREDIDYLEDWDFLLSLIYANAKVAFLNETLSEYRIIGDGNTEQKKNPEHFSHCQRIVNARAGLVAKRVGIGRFYRDVLDFDFSTRPPLSRQDVAHMQAALDIFTLVASPLELSDK